MEGIKEVERRSRRTRPPQAGGWHHPRTIPSSRSDLVPAETIGKVAV